MNKIYKNVVYLKLDEKNKIINSFAGFLNFIKIVHTVLIKTR